MNDESRYLQSSQRATFYTKSTSPIGPRRKIIIYE